MHVLFIVLNVSNYFHYIYTCIWVCTMYTNVVEYASIHYLAGVYRNKLMLNTYIRIKVYIHTYNSLN